MRIHATIGVGIVALISMIPLAVFVHIPFAVDTLSDTQIDTSGIVIVTDPTISRAYYDTIINGDTRLYRIESADTFTLTLTLLVPARTNPDGRFAAMIYRNGDMREMLDVLDGTLATWEYYHEPFGNDTYFRGPELVREMGPGIYEIEVMGVGSAGKYVLSIGSVESFSIRDSLHSLRTIPMLKSAFFGTSPATFIRSPLGVVQCIVSILFGIILGWGIRHLWSHIPYGDNIVSPKVKNMSVSQNQWFTVVGALFFLTAGIAIWSPWMMVASGVAWYQVGVWYRQKEIQKPLIQDNLL